MGAYPTRCSVMRVVFVVVFFERDLQCFKRLLWSWLLDDAFLVSNASAPLPQRSEAAESTTTALTIIGRAHVTCVSIPSAAGCLICVQGGGARLCSRRRLIRYLFHVTRIAVVLCQHHMVYYVEGARSRHLFVVLVRVCCKFRFQGTFGRPG